MKDYFNVKLPDGEIQNISSLGLAHVGDAVFELMVRVWLCSRGKITSRSLHRAAVTYVSASAQSSAAETLKPRLTEEELAVYKRGRNAHVNSVPNSSSYEQYHAATGLEALFGFLYLSGRTERLNELFDAVVSEPAVRGK